MEEKRKMDQGEKKLRKILARFRIKQVRIEFREDLLEGTASVDLYVDEYDYERHDPSLLQIVLLVEEFLRNYPRWKGGLHLAIKYPWKHLL